MVNEVRIILLENVEVSLATDTPDIQNLIDTIVRNKESIDPDNIKVIAPQNSKFDEKGFEEILKNTIRTFLEDIQIENKKYKEFVQDTFGKK